MLSIDTTSHRYNSKAKLGWRPKRRPKKGPSNLVEIQSVSLTQNEKQMKAVEGSKVESRESSGWNIGDAKVVNKALSIPNKE